MLADQDVRLRSSVGERHHQLSRVPERDDDVSPASIEFVNLVMPSCLDAHRTSKQPDQPGTNGGKNRELGPLFKLLHYWFIKPIRHADHDKSMYDSRLRRCYPLATSWNCMVWSRL